MGPFPFIAPGQNGGTSQENFKNLGELVNSERDDFAPVLTLEENTLYFTSDRPLGTKEQKGYNVFVSRRADDGTWKKPKPLPLGREKSETSVGISPDGNTLFIQREGDLYQVEKQGRKGWKRPRPMADVINSEHEETQGSLSSDGNTFYFVSDRSGDRDIYRVKRLPTGDWSKAKELPSSINTPEAENAPFIHPDGRTLFFSSSGHSEGDKADIFYSKKGKDGDWGEPVNMGYPVSTKARNLHIMTSADGKRAYFASNSIQANKEDKDLYRLDLKGSFTEGLAVLKGFIDVPSGSDLLDSTRIRIERPKGMEGSERPWIQRPQEQDGEFIAVLPPCHEYTLNYMLGNRKMKEQKLYIPCHSGYQKIRKEVFLQPVNFDPDVLDREPSLIGRVRHESGAAVSKGKLFIIGEEGQRLDSVSIGKNGDFSFYHPDRERKELLFRFVKDGPCKNSPLRLSSGGQIFDPLGQDGCLYRFPTPR